MNGARINLWPGALALGLALGLTATALTALLVVAPLAAAPQRLVDPYAIHVLGFTALQATLSTVLSLAFGLPVARALARRPAFPGRALLLDLFGLPLVMPVIVAVLGVVAVWGRQGYLSELLAGLGLGRLPAIYGLVGILIAHVFFNMPLAVRLLLAAWQAIPGETWRLAAQLGMGSGAILRLIEWPRLKVVLPGVAALIFLLCFASFTVVLALGGGPRSTTLEVAIWQALRLDFDVPRAVTLALLQLVLCGILGALLAAAGGSIVTEATEERPAARPDAATRAARVGDTVAIGVGAVFVLLPLTAIVVAGLAGPIGEVLSRASVWLATLRSLAVGIGAGLLSLALAAGIAVTGRDLAVRRGRPGLADRLEMAGGLNLVVSPTVMGAGLFVLLMAVTDVFSLALPVAALVNGIVAVPYALRALGPELRRSAQHHDRLCASLGIAGFDRLRLVEWPVLRRACGMALALGTALGVGDLTAIALFGNQDSQTLPLMLYNAMGSYRMNDAAVIALLLAVLCLAVFVVIERIVGGRARA